MKTAIMKYVDGIGALFGIVQHTEGWQIVEAIAGKASPWPGSRSPIYPRKAEAMMWLDSYANTFHWKEVHED